MMRKLARRGNSVVLRIPASVAREQALDDGSEVDIAVSKEAPLVTPPDQDETTLEDLVAGITNENRHAAVETGPSVGAEFA